jgi:S-adenosyl-L-methionine hydrolase (adenosine-forming)
MPSPRHRGASVRIITLTTDFGRADPWVGIMKGVILGISPAARLVDLSHEVAPQDVAGGQLVLEAAVPFFPPGSVHLAVVDPGVGSARRPLLVAAGGHFFVGPDNGLFTFAFDIPGWSAVALEREDLRLPGVSATFHGRDVFAPAAAHLARGEPADRFGRAITDPVRWSLPVAQGEGDAIVGEVIAVDRFGNLITSITAADLDRLGGSGPASLEVGGTRVGRVATSYADGPEGAPAAIVGSSRRLEVFVREGNASAILAAGRGTTVRAWRA